MVARENMPNYVRLLTVFGNAQVRKKPVCVVRTARSIPWENPALRACPPACLPACLPAFFRARRYVDMPCSQPVQPA